MKWTLKRYARLLCAMAVAVCCLMSGAAQTAYSYPQDMQELLDEQGVLPGNKGMEADGSASIPCQGYIFPGLTPSVPPVNTAYKVTYNSGGGSGSYQDTGIPAGTAYVVLSAEQTGISRSGYGFSGWNTRSDGSGKAYAPGGTLTVSGDVALYAQWKEDGGGPETPASPEPTVSPDPDPTAPAEPQNPDDPGDPDDPSDPYDPAGPTGPTEPAKPEPPRPANPGHTLVPGEDGTYIELDEEGVPLGIWTLDDGGEWVFEPYPTPESLPKTGVEDTLPLWILGLCISLVMTALLIYAGHGRKRI